MANWRSHRQTVRFFGLKNEERLSKGLDVKWHIPSTCLDAARMWFSTGTYSTNRIFRVAMAENPTNPSNGQNVHRFQARTPICHIVSEAWEPPRFQEKRSRSGKAILGALGEFRGILGAALGIGSSILGIRNSILGMASHDLINMKPTILGATLGAIPRIAANPPGTFSFAPSFSELFFENWGGPCAQDCTCFTLLRGGAFGTRGVCNRMHRRKPWANPCNRSASSLPGSLLE